MNSATRRSILCGAVSALGACASLRDPAPGALQIGGVYEVTLTRTWSDFTPNRAHNLRLLSLYGLALDRLYLAALKERDGLSPTVPAGIERTRNLSAENAGSFIRNSIVALGYADPEVEAIESGPFGDRQGWRMGFATRTGDGLEILGGAALAAHSGRLCVILNLAARAHYFIESRRHSAPIYSSVVLR